jgi:2-oxoglutarate/2-oxoacid ferredoxin oxidoreductase subunit alpha
LKNGSLNILIGGPAGAGIEKSGRTLTLSFVRGGYKVFANVEHMSVIRGGNNYLRLRIDKKRRDAHSEEVDIMIALDKKTVEEHVNEMNDGGVILYDSASIDLGENFDSGKGKLIGVDLKKIATEELGNPLMENIISLGIVCGLVDFDVSLIKKVLGKIFAKKSAEIISLNEKAADIGYEMASEKWAKDFPIKMPKGEGKNEMFITGNEAFSMGAIKAGCKYVGEYPMTPSSSILHFMAKWAEKYGIVVKQTEDEISACLSCIGAGYTGVRAMTGTSGGGYALMTESIGLAGMNEVPIVVGMVMRPGPATGLPTRGDQGDLRQVIHGAQGDPLKIVLLPGDVEECFKMGFEAFNLAEKYQMPVIVCYERHLGESFYTIPAFDEKGLKVDRGKVLKGGDIKEGEDYKRYLLTEDGVSSRAIPGVRGGIHRSTSDEHDEYGDMDESPSIRKAMVEKRMKKIEMSLKDCFEPEVYGSVSVDDADLTFVTWGGTKGICIEACEILGVNGVKANVLRIKTALPFHTEMVKKLLSACKRPVLVEHNFTGQLGGLIAENTGILIDEKILRYDGRPMTAKWVVERVLKNK